MDELAKLDEAQYFLAGMREAEAAGDGRAFRYELSAFLSAARSVLQYALAECERKSRSDWYELAVSRDACLRFLKLQRDDNIHGRPASPMEIESVEVADDGRRSAVTEFFFVGWQGVENAVALGERCLRVLAALVADGQSAGILTVAAPNYNIGDTEARAEARRCRRTPIKLTSPERNEGSQLIAGVVLGRPRAMHVTRESREALSRASFFLAKSEGCSADERLELRPSSRRPSSLRALACTAYRPSTGSTRSGRRGGTP